MRTIYRPFVKTFLVESTFTSGVTLTDSTGAEISCNFVNLTTSSGSNDSRSNLIFLEPSGMTSNVPTGPSVGASAGSGTGEIVASGCSAIDGSGALGDCCSPNNGVAQLVLGIGDRVSAVSISNMPAEVTDTTANGTFVRCFLTYGNVNVQNPLKDGEYGRGS